jgi:hypothetical protein
MTGHTRTRPSEPRRSGPVGEHPGPLQRRFPTPDCRFPAPTHIEFVRREPRSGNGSAGMRIQVLWFE